MKYAEAWEELKDILHEEWTNKSIYSDYSAREQARAIAVIIHKMEELEEKYE